MIMRDCGICAYPCNCFAAGLVCMMPEWIMRMVLVWMLLCVLAVLDGSLTCAVCVVRR